ncbi:hypothetical protein IF1G_11030 [Cordyceps javanica]|uniref:Uncharacterized protein n=1 Tax=Cordyceps javanica TaxID=43265 RepID=A0A545ULD2_9HYPO|nr:hypothetical protein IF1G_11030 [Cordyceps javanica]
MVRNSHFTQLSALNSSLWKRYSIDSIATHKTSPNVCHPHVTLRTRLTNNREMCFSRFIGRLLGSLASISGSCPPTP